MKVIAIVDDDVTYHEDAPEGLTPGALACLEEGYTHIFRVNDNGTFESADVVDGELIWEPLKPNALTFECLFMLEIDDGD